MRLKVINNNLDLEVDEDIREKTINIFDFEIEFSEEWDNLDKKIIYVQEDKIYENAILDNKSVVPPLPRGYYSIGIVGVITENNKIIKRKATNMLPHVITISAAGYEPNMTNEEIEASTYEAYLKSITEKSNEISQYLKDIGIFYIKIEEDREEVADNTALVKELTDGLADFATAMQYPVFWVDEDMNLKITHAEKMKNLLFSLNEKTGNLEVKILRGQVS